ncbi:hypothetical protein [Chitinophaga sp.]|uniref:hypothetical protein n=1 Tax=Chitinophaga sp. TaxID=1869181 RepID=UPI0031E13258
MKPLILEFAETSSEPAPDFTMIEYSDTLNLNVLKKTQSPAIILVSMDTLTGTFDQTESSDADPTRPLNIQLDTSTGTKVMNEVSDTDNTRLLDALDTATGTRENNEVPDEDRSHCSLFQLLDTATATNTQNPDLEITDTDNEYQ